MLPRQFPLTRCPPFSRLLVEYDKEGNEIRPTVKKLVLNRDEKLIAKAINHFNIESKQ